MAGALIIIVIVLLVAGNLDKWQSKEEPKGTFTLDEIEEIFKEDSNNK